LRESEQFEKFFKANYAKAYFLALSIVHDEEVSRDVVGDSFEFILKRFATDSFDDMTGYLLTTVKNACFDYFRKKNVRDRYAQLYLMMTDETAVNDDHDERVEKIMAAMEELTPRTRQIMSACYVERKKYREVAAELDISESAVKKHIMQALKFFRTKFVKSPPAGV
jgi:RNA polymerase sigma-70 factor (ECF subfamily)